ncbi:glycosyltransferase family 29 protein [Hydrogenovibrio sp. SC-1]|uniref:glycosyltransferase family 29 protein n=1 Tax=Hydrogenovibrio sp. SC-1 TaxID=2065820 RepID=UPI0013041BF8|nr:glycosyltransferase family 29 protein [Hydrogenovibrio sp. SC-1]
MKAVKDIQQLANLVKGKRVAIIGNSQKLQAKGEEIDAFDIVVRMNRAWDLPTAMKQDVGTKTDIVCLSADREKLATILSRYSDVVWMTPKKRSELEPLLLPSLFFYPLDYWKSLHQQLGARPSTGCMVFDLFSRLVDKGHLTMYGFDFFQNPNWYDMPAKTNWLRRIFNRHRKSSPHDWSAEKAYILAEAEKQNITIKKLDEM